MSTTSYGLCFHRDEPAATVIERSQAAEAAGFDEFWLIEDCFYTAGISLAATALAVTSTITVGVGIMPVVARNAAVTAMEIATLAQIAPGRFHAGLGHGVQDWMRQMDAAVASPLTVLEETFDVVQRLLAGETVTVEGRYVTLNDVTLDQPPARKPLLSAGVRGPKSLAVSRRVADGTILADFVNADYVRWVRNIVGDDHRVTVFASLAMGPTEAHADIRAGTAGHLAKVAGDGAEDIPISLKMAPFFCELAAEAAASSWFEAAVSMPDEWLTQIAAFGTPDQAAGYVESLVAAGADAVAFFPNPEDALGDGEYTSRELLPLLR
ncbi:MAG: LLM class flavin-dependent oxidoreductase [Acidimicrobiales bacterium]